MIGQTRRCSGTWIRKICALGRAERSSFRRPFRFRGPGPSLVIFLVRGRRAAAVLLLLHRGCQVPSPSSSRDIVVITHQERPILIPRKHSVRTVYGCKETRTHPSAGKGGEVMKMNKCLKHSTRGSCRRRSPLGCTARWSNPGSPLRSGYWPGTRTWQRAAPTPGLGRRSLCVHSAARAAHTRRPRGTATRPVQG